MPIVIGISLLGISLQNSTATRQFAAQGFAIHGGGRWTVDGSTVRGSLFVVRWC
jgi:hypothetical protein